MKLRRVTGSTPALGTSTDSEYAPEESSKLFFFQERLIVLIRDKTLLKQNSKLLHQDYKKITCSRKIWLLPITESATRTCGQSSE